ncbi:MAG: FAD-dependent oxidoreductase [Erysipelotrichaceae bacterium]
MNESFWIEETSKTNYQSVKNDFYIDTLIIGGGICGLSTAYYLSKTCSDFCLVEAHLIAHGASGRSSGKITSQHGAIYHDLIKHQGIAKTALYYQSHEEALQSITSIIKENQIDCDFKILDSVLYADKETSIPALQAEYQACLDLAIPCTYLNKCDTPFPNYGGIIFHNQAQFQPVKYLQGLGEIINKKATIYENSSVSKILKEDNYYLVTINSYLIKTNRIIFATQFPFIDEGNFFFTRVYPESSFILSALTKKTLSQQYINIEEKVHSYRSYQDHLFVGGLNKKVGKFDKAELTKFKQHTLQTLQLDQDIHLWYSQDMMSFDSIALIGKLNKNDDSMLLATGFSKWGNTTGTIAGKILCAYLNNETSPYQELYDPHRLSNLFSFAFIKENSLVLYDYLKSKLTKTSEEWPAMKEAKVIVIDSHKYGAYQDETRLYLVDITCPHLGCTLSFQSESKLWCCPCHGSCFHVDGSIAKGPANAKLNFYGEGLNKIDPHIFKESTNK